MFKRLLYAIGRLLSRFFNIGIRLKYVLIIVVLLTAGCIGITYSKVVRAVGGKEDYNEAMRYIEIKDIISDHFIDGVDRSTMGDSAAAAIASGLGDKWSYFMTADEYQAYQLSSSSEYSGIGMSILKDEHSGAFQIVSVNQGSLADKAGLTSGMLITSVDSQNVTGMEIDEMRTLIRSKLNTKFELGIGSRDTVTVNCATTYVSTVVYRMEKTGAGYIQLKDFEAGSGQDAVKALEDLLAQGATALVIDVRGNTGGLAEEARIFLDSLLPNCTLFIEADKQGQEKKFESDGVCIQLPTVLLLDSQTYGIAEVFAAVMQEYKWATLLGEATSGTTRRQEIFALDDGSALNLSTKTYITANGVDISKNGGVVPEVIMHNTDPEATGTTAGTTGTSTAGTSTSNDEQLMAALKLLS